MAIRRGRNEAADKLFTYAVLALAAAGLVGGGVFLYNHLGATVGLTTEVILLEEGVEIAPGEAKRFPNQCIEPRGRSIIRYRLEIEPTRGEVYGGLVHPGTKLEPGNLVWTQSGAGILRAVQGRRTQLGEKLPPGTYDVIVENRAPSPASTKVTLRILYAKE